jgi:hypothetical protein
MGGGQIFEPACFGRLLHCRQPLFHPLDEALEHGRFLINPAIGGDFPSTRAAGFSQPLTSLAESLPR